MFELLTDSLFVAICRSNWLYSRKYKIVWYHPACSRFYLTAFILCQFQGKMTGTLPDSNARATCVKPANPACYVLGVRCWFYVNKHTSQAVHPRQIPQVARTGQTGQEHRSDWCNMGSSGWATPVGQLLQIKTSISRITQRTWTIL
jgi:hypothetical protein